MTRLKSVPPRSSEYSSRRSCQSKDESPVDSPSADSDNANEGALSASVSASASPQPQSNGPANTGAVADVDAEAMEAGADSSSSSSTPITRSVALSLVTWQLFQQEKARISASMTDSMFVDWLLTHIRPSAYSQQFRAPQTSAAAVQDAPTAGEGGVSTPVAAGSVQALPSGEADGSTVSLLPNMHMTPGAAALNNAVAASAGGAGVSGGSSANRLFCAICRKHFSSRAGLIQHQRGMHAWQPHFRCNKCGQRFRWASQLHDHRRKGYCPCINLAPSGSPPAMIPGVVDVEPPPTMAPPPPSITFAASLTSGPGSLKEAAAASASAAAGSSRDLDRDLDCASSNSPVEDELDEAGAASEAKSAATGDMDDLIKALEAKQAKQAASEASSSGGGGGGGVGGVSCPECAFSTGSRDELEQHFKSDHVVEDLFSCTCGSDFPCLSLFLCHYIGCPIAATDLGTQGKAPGAKEGRPDAKAAAQHQHQQHHHHQQQQQQQQSVAAAAVAAAGLLPNGLALPAGGESSTAAAAGAAATGPNDPPPLTFGPQAYGMGPGQAAAAAAAAAAGGPFYPPLRGPPMAPHEAALNAAGIAVGRPRAPNGQASCQYCHQTFSNKNTLKQHIIGMHSHQAQYHCEHCGKPFRWAPSYYTHRRKCGLALCGLGPSPRGRGRAATAAVGRY